MLSQLPVASSGRQEGLRHDLSWPIHDSITSGHGDGKASALSLTSMWLDSSLGRSQMPQDVTLLPASDCQAVHFGGITHVPQSSLGSCVARGAALLAEGLRLFLQSAYAPALGFAPFRF